MAPLPPRDRTESPNSPMPEVDPELGARDATQVSAKVPARKSAGGFLNLAVQFCGVVLALSFGVFAVLSYRASDNALTATKTSNQIALLQWCASTNNNVTRPICDDIYVKTNLSLIVWESYGPPTPPPDDENSRGAWIMWIMWIAVAVVAAIALLTMLLAALLYLENDYGQWAGLVWRTWKDRRRRGLTTRWRDLPEVFKSEPSVEQQMLHALAVENNLRRCGFI